MKPVEIDIKNATLEELRAEGKRLGINGIGATVRITTLRQKLNRYHQDYRLYHQWIYLLQMLPGGKEIAVPAGIETLMDSVCDLLYDLLLREGYVLLAQAFDGEGKVKEQLDKTMFSKRKPIFDFANARNFHVVGRQNTRVVDTTAGGYSVLHAAQCAFPTVRFIFAEWEKWRKEGNKGPQ